MKRKEAYRIVLADLKKNLHCKDKDFAIGCYSCGLRLVYKTLKSHFDFEDEVVK